MGAPHQPRLVTTKSGHASALWCCARGHVVAAEPRRERTRFHNINKKSKYDIQQLSVARRAQF
jgi:hypothetical protein